MKRLLVLLPLLAACGAPMGSPPSAPSSGGKSAPVEEFQGTTTPAPAPPPPPPPVVAGAMDDKVGSAPGSRRAEGKSEVEQNTTSGLDQARPGEPGRNVRPSDSQGARPDGDHAQRPGEVAGGKSAGLVIRAVPLAGQLNKQPFQAAAALVSTVNGRARIEIFDQARTCEDKTPSPNHLSLSLPSWVPSAPHEMPAASAFFVVGGKNQPTRKAVFELPSAPNAGDRGKLRLLLASSTAGNEVEGEIEFLRCD